MERERKRFEKWFHGFDDGSRVEPLYEIPRREVIRVSIWERVDRVTRPRRRWMLSVGRLKAAAAVVAVCAVAWWVYQYRFSEVGEDIPMRVFTSQPGQQLRITLPDGTAIRLKGGSRIQVPERFLADARTVRLLDGEAFFSVSRDTLRPFTVQSRDVSTRVLGTEFNISAYSDDAEASVAVKSGKVEVSGVGNEYRFTLLSGDKVSYHAERRAFRQEKLAVASVGSWTANRLVYRDANLGHILRDLQRMYGVPFLAGTPQITGCRYTISFDNLTLHNALTKLELLGDLAFETRSDTIHVTGRGCP